MAKKKTVKKTTTTTVVEEEVVANNTHIICVLDGSSSMNTIINEARDGFNKFLKEQQELDGEATLSVATFSSGFGNDNGYNLLYDNVDVDKVKPLTEKDWYGNGMTALYDAIGKAITDAKQAHLKLSKKDRPDRVLVAIVTDGHENASREFNQETIKTLIKAQEKDDWQFIYLAADQDATLAATSIGVSAGNAVRYKNSGVGNTVVFDAMSMATSNYRGISGSGNIYSRSASLMSDITDGKNEVGEDSLNKKKK